MLKKFGGGGKSRKPDFFSTSDIMQLSQKVDIPGMLSLFMEGVGETRIFFMEAKREPEFFRVYKGGDQNLFA